MLSALWKNKRTRFLALGLVGVRFAVRAGLGAVGCALGTQTGGLFVGLLMAVLGTVMAWGDQWLVLRTLRRTTAVPVTTAAVPVTTAAVPVTTTAAPMTTTAPAPATAA
ncbi:hypothetical protein ACIRF8_24155 [Streptomyces sp. NPDC102406]|uniref:hypothetical protein n=1 Tax=Streptomyces sp. NPDC102406 TaxID=3366171 RepID=UPI003805F1CA